MCQREWQSRKTVVIANVRVEWARFVCWKGVLPRAKPSLGGACYVVSLWSPGVSAAHYRRTHAIFTDQTCFGGIFAYADMQPILQQFCVYHVNAPGQHDGAPPLSRFIARRRERTAPFRSLRSLVVSSSSRETSPSLAFLFSFTLHRQGGPRERGTRAVAESVPHVLRRPNAKVLSLPLE